MRCPLAAVLVWSLAAAGAARAGDGEVEAAIDRAVAAMGGEEALKKAEAFTYAKRDAVLPKGGVTEESVTRVTVQGASRRRVDTFAPGPVAAGDLPQLSVVVDRAVGWLQAPGLLSPLPHENVTSARYDISVESASFNLGPLRDGSTWVELIGEKELNGRPAIGLKANRADGLRFEFYFDKASGLPIRSILLPPEGSSGSELTTVDYFDYKDFGGLKVATRRIVTKTLHRLDLAPKTVHLVDFKTLDKVDPKMFDKPA